MQCKDRVITIEGEVIEGALGSISADGIVEIAGQKLPMDGLRSIVPGSGADQAKDLSDGRVVLICGSEIAASGVKVLEEEVMCTVGGLGEVRLPIDAVRALRFGELIRGSRFQKGLLEWEASRDLDTIFISGGAELQEVDGLIEEVNDGALIFDREDALQSIPLVRAYGVVLASPLLKAEERPAVVLSLAGGTRLRADIDGFSEGKVNLSLVEGVDVVVPWNQVRRITISSERLEYLSDIAPLKERSRPVLAPGRSWQRDRTVSGLPIKIGDQVYDKGLGFASGMSVTFPNEGLHDLFIAEIGIDIDSGIRGDCEFVVLCENREVFRKRKRGGEPADLIKVDIKGASDVTLRVDYGEDLDIADHADWGEACFIQRSK
ncbi:MAG: NPCBM/NEW2 domain-containing protein [Verrucomicrobiota bacterium]|nr:NPCBM/NEW2 domain-containing protein [Verrucomicrobiota bacterium]